MAPKKKKLIALPLSKELRAVGKRVELAWSDERWRAGTVVRSFAKSFHVTLDKLDPEEINPFKIKDKVGHWRVALGVAAPATRKKGKKRKIPATSNEAECDAPPARTAAGAKQKLKKAAKRLEELTKTRELPVAAIVTAKSKKAKDPNTLVQTFRAGDFKLAGRLIDYREKDSKGRVVRDSEGWVFGADSQIGSRRFSRWGNLYPSNKNKKVPLVCAVYMSGVFMRGTTVLHGPFVFCTKYEKITGKDQQFYMLESEDITSVRKTVLAGRDVGHLVGEIRTRWGNHYGSMLAELFATEEEAAEETSDDDDAAGAAASGDDDVSCSLPLPLSLHCIFHSIAWLQFHRRKRRRKRRRRG